MDEINLVNQENQNLNKLKQKISEWDTLLAPLDESQLEILELLSDDKKLVIFWLIDLLAIFYFVYFTDSWARREDRWCKGWW
jgi:hypothetical protein